MSEPEKLTGVGTDIFIRKAKPGSTIGFGYFVDIYQNGVKQHSTRVRTKKEVLEIINDYKEKYHTDRSFQNELQVHVTYKTKEERGEKAMDNMDQALYRKAATIENLMKSIINPDAPIKTRIAASDVTQGIVDFVPETANPEGKTDAIMNEASIANEVSKKIVDYFNTVSPASSTTSTIEPEIPGTEPVKMAEVGAETSAEWPQKDELYNTMKKWLTAVKKKVIDYAKSNESQINLDQIADAVGNVVHSGDPEKIKAETGIEVSIDVANKIKEITTMSVGNLSGPGGERSPKTLTEGALNPQASSKERSKYSEEDAIEELDSIIDKMLEQFRVFSGSMPSEAVMENVLDDMSISDGMLQKIQEHLKKNPRNETEAVIAILNFPTDVDIKKMEEAAKKYDRSSIPASGDTFSATASEFWEYAGRNKVGYIEDIFVEWAENKNLQMKEASEIWNNVSASILELFHSKQASYLGKSDFEAALKPIVDIVVATINAPTDQAQDYNQMIEQTKPYWYSYIKAEVMVMVMRKTKASQTALTEDQFKYLLRNELTSQRKMIIPFISQAIDYVVGSASNSIDQTKRSYADTATNTLREIDPSSLYDEAIAFIA